MIKDWIYIFLFPCLSLTAQNNNASEAAFALHQEGITLMNKEDITAFDKLIALEKFLQCHQQLESTSTTDDTLLLKNEAQVKRLFDLFTEHPNTDSLIQTTRFFPDSIFEANTNYSPATKALTTEFLTVQRSIQRAAFFKIRRLQYPTSLLKEGTVSPRINFENYWAQEVIQLEKWIARKEQQWGSYSKKASDELLESQLQNELALLQSQEQNKSHASNKKMQAEQVQIATEKLEKANRDYQRLKNISLGALGLLLLLGYFLWKRNDKLLKSNTQSFLEEKKRSDDLLTNILPPEVVRELKKQGTVKAQKKEEVSVFFSDFKNFSQIAETLSPEELVKELDTCFTIFDRIIDKHRLQKIKTIGDAYMCVGGLYTQGGNHIYRIVLAALEIQQFLADRKKDRLKNGELFFEARIGIHTGPIVAGVIGRKKIAFDVWGDTVNVAQQMEQHSEVGKVNISGETFNFVQDKFDCIQRGTLTAKNKKEYEMYYVNKAIKS